MLPRCYRRIKEYARSLGVRCDRLVDMIMHPAFAPILRALAARDKAAMSVRKCDALVSGGKAAVTCIVRVNGEEIMRGEAVRIGENAWKLCMEHDGIHVCTDVEIKERLLARRESPRTALRLAARGLAMDLIMIAELEEAVKEYREYWQRQGDRWMLRAATVCVMEDCSDSIRDILEKIVKG